MQDSREQVQVFCLKEVTHWISPVLRPGKSQLLELTPSTFHKGFQAQWHCHIHHCCRGCEARKARCRACDQDSKALQLETGGCRGRWRHSFRHSHGTQCRMHDHRRDLRQRNTRESCGGWRGCRCEWFCWDWKLHIREKVARLHAQYLLFQKKWQDCTHNSFFFKKICKIARTIPSFSEKEGRLHAQSLFLSSKEGIFHVQSLLGSPRERSS